MTWYRYQSPSGQTYRVEAPTPEVAADLVEEALRNTEGGGSMFEPLLSGITAGTMDELQGVLGGVHKTIQGGSFGEGYDEKANAFRERQRQFTQRNPAGAATMEIGGALMTLPATGGVNVVRVPQIARNVSAAAKAGNVLARGGARAINAGATGALYGGIYGAATADPKQPGLTDLIAPTAPGGQEWVDLGSSPVAERIEGALEGGAVGAGVGLATPVATGTVGWIAQEAFGRPLKAIANAVAPRNRAQSLLRQAIKDDAAVAGISPGQAAANLEMAQRAGVPMKPLDIGESTRDLGRVAANMSPQGRDILNQAVNQRFETQVDRLIETIAATAPGINAPQTSRLLQDAARNTNRAKYARAYQDGARGVWHEGFEQLMVSPDIQAAIKDATRIGASEAALRGTRPPVNPFRTNQDGTIGPIPDVMPTLEFWDHVKRSLDGQIGMQIRAGNGEYASLLSRLKTQLVGYLDQAVPSYRQARQTAASFFGSDDALEAGRLFVRRTGDNAGVREAIDRMTPAERQLFGEGFATQIIEDLRNIPDRHTVITKIFQSPAARERFEIALGPNAADAMEATLRLEAIMDLGRAAVQGNSTTARQLIAQAMVGTAAGSALSPPDPSNPVSFVPALLGAAFTVGIGNRARAGMDRAGQQMARELADMLASNDPQVVRQAITRITRQPGGMDALRRAHTWVTRALQPIVAKEGGATVPAMVDAGGGSQPAQAQD